MNRNIIIAIVIVTLFVLFSVGVFTLYINNKRTATVASPSPAQFQSLISPTPSPSASSNQMATYTPSTLPASGISDVVIKRHGITLIDPRDQNSAYSPLVVEGYGNVFEGQLTIVLKDANGTRLAVKNATACMGEDACPFRTVLEFPQPATVAGTLEVFSASPKDGSTGDIETISVRFR